MIPITWIAITLSFMFICSLLYFRRNLRWSNEEDRVAILGFSMMIGVLVVDILLLYLWMR